MSYTTKEEDEQVLSMLQAIKDGKWKALNERWKAFEENIDVFLNFQKKTLALPNKALRRIKKDQDKTMISLRTNSTSLDRIKMFAKQEKVPYHTFLNACIDEIAEGLPVSE